MLTLGITFFWFFIFAVFAGFVPDVDDAFASACLDTGIATAVEVFAVAIVAGLALLDDAVTAARQFTLIGTAVIVDVVAIIAGLESCLDNAIATAGLGTVITA